MFKRIFAVLTALVMLVAAAGVSLAETAVTEKTAGLTIEDIKALNGGPVTVHTDQGRVTFVGGTCSAEPVKSDELDTPRDILFYENRPETAAIEGRVVMEPGDYAIYFPWDVHVPGQCGAEGPKAYRKIVLKVPVEACLG